MTQHDEPSDEELKEWQSRAFRETTSLVLVAFQAGVAGRKHRANSPTHDPRPPSPAANSAGANRGRD